MRAGDEANMSVHLEITTLVLWYVSAMVPHTCTTEPASVANKVLLPRPEALAPVSSLGHIWRISLTSGGGSSTHEYLSR